MASSAFRDYWAKKTDSDHSHRPGFDVFRIAAQEVKAFYDPDVHKRILDLGCGAGEVFHRLEWADRDYTGVDFSESMLSIFRGRFPSARLLVGDATTFRLDESFDLILSNNVAQYCTPRALRSLLSNAAGMLSPTGMLVVGNIPHKAMRIPYYAGKFAATPLPRTTRMRRLAGMVRDWRVDSIGYWHQPEDIQDVARAMSLECTFFGCILARYRFTATLRPPRRGAH